MKKSKVNSTIDRVRTTGSDPGKYDIPISDSDQYEDYILGDPIHEESDNYAMSWCERNTIDSFRRRARWDLFGERWKGRNYQRY